MIIGLSGKKRSGKSVTAEYLMSNYGFHEVAWAFPLKEFIGKELFDLSENQLYGSRDHREALDPRWNMSARTILQKVGTDFFRKEIDPDFWIKVGKRRIFQLLKNNQSANIVISDCRFPNEMKAIKEVDGVTLRIERIGLISEDTHESETALDDYDFDHTIVSGDGVDKLHLEIDKWMEQQ